MGFSKVISQGYFQMGLVNNNRSSAVNMEGDDNNDGYHEMNKWQKLTASTQKKKQKTVNARLPCTTEMTTRILTDIVSRPI